MGLGMLYGDYIFILVSTKILFTKKKKNTKQKQNFVKSWLGIIN